MFFTANKLTIADKLHEAIEEKIASERKKVDTDPTEGQKEAGNYKHGHISINGFKISIENPKGSYRKGKDRNGKEWKTLMKNDYGYFLSTLGKDGDAIDVFIGDNFDSKKIFAVDQKVGGKFDETKVMFCFNDKEQAKKAYLSNYEKDWKGFWKITEVDINTFKKWLYDGYRQRKPFFDYVEIQKSKLNEEIEKSDKLIAKNIVDDSKDEETSKIGYNGIKKDEYGTWILSVNGGLNGHGKDEDYLKDVLELYQKLSEKFKVWIADVKVDCLDDVFDIDFGLDKKENKKSAHK